MQNPQIGASKQRKLSLKWSLMLLILTCWLLPLLILLWGSHRLSVYRTQQHVTDIVTTSVSNAVDVAHRTLENVMDASLGASYFPTVRNAYSDFLEDGNRALFYNTIKNNFLSRQYGRSHSINASFLLFPNISVSNASKYGEDLFFAYNPSLSSYDDVQYFYSGPAQLALAQKDELGSDIGFITAGGRLYMLRVLSLQNNHFSPYAILVLEVNLPALYAGIQNLPWVPAFTLKVNDVSLGYGEVVLPHGLRPGPQAATLPQAGNRVLVYGRNEGPRFSLEYYATADLQPLLHEIGSSTNLIFFGLLSIPLMAVVLLFFSRMINRPIRRLRDFAHNIEGGDFGRQIEEDKLGSLEFSSLGGQMNAMSARLQDQFERLYREELALRDARIKALQSQINPHFLGNTLEIINWEARLAGNEKISHMLEALTTMLAAVLDRRHRPLIHLSEEMVYVNAYLYIIKERLGKRITVDVDIPDALLDWYVPRLVLHTVVENAVEHGVSSRSSGRVLISAVQEDDEWMRLEVVNDSPLKVEDEARINAILGDGKFEAEASAGNIGIRNVHQRLRIIYGEGSGLSVKTDKRDSTISSMRIGCVQSQQNEST